MKTPLISVIMPAYNSEKYISEAIESILSQTYTDFEFIIIDDGSIDKTAFIIQKYAQKDSRIIFLKNTKNLKICKTLNKGINIAKGKYIARMDSDDISLPERFQKQIDFLEKNPNIGVLGGAIHLIDKSGLVYGKREYPISDKEIRNKIFRFNPFCHPTTMMRKTVVQEVGLYDEKEFLAEDYDLYFRIGNNSKFENLNNFLLKYRTYSDNSTSSYVRNMEKKTLKIRLKAVKEYGYKMSFFDKIFNLLQYISLYIIPSKYKIFLFNLFRNSKK